MYMGDFWNSVSILTPGQVQKQFPRALNATPYSDTLTGEFAFDVIPNLGPGGYISDEDAELNYEDPESEDYEGDSGFMSTEEILPSVTGRRSLMYYIEDIDELYTWDNDKWTLWNY